MHIDCIITFYLIFIIKFTFTLYLFNIVCEGKVWTFIFLTYPLECNHENHFFLIVSGTDTTRRPVLFEPKQVFIGPNEHPLPNVSLLPLPLELGKVSVEIEKP